MSFAVNYDKATMFSLPDTGTYETYVEKAQEGVTQNGATRIQVVFKIRKDFQQSFTGQSIFHSIFRKKETNQYNEGMIHALAKGCGIPNGTQFQSLDAMLGALVGKAVKVNVTKKQETYNNQTRDVLNVDEMTPSQLPPVTVQPQQPMQQQGYQAVPTQAGGFAPQMMIQDSDLPF